MKLVVKFILFAALVSLIAPAGADGRDADARIRLLEQQLAEQREMIAAQQVALDAMQAELNQLKDVEAVSVVVTRDDEVDPMVAASESDALEAEPAATMELSGFINLDMIYDFDRVAPDYESTLVPTTIPTEPGLYGTDGNFIASIKQSRLAFQGKTATPYGDASAWLEFDLFGTGSDAGRTAFNLRHAWFELGRWGAGQTWSTFMDISTWPNVYDWWGPSGMALNRNAMLRYTVPLDDEGSHWAVALEKQNGSFNVGFLEQIAPGLQDVLQPKSDAPDLVARWRAERDWGHLQVAGVARRLSVETVGLEDISEDLNEFGWGINVTGIFNVFGRDQVKYGLTWGKGIASFINDGGGSNLAPSVGASEISIEPMESLGYMIYYDHYWSDKWSTSFGLSQNDNKLTNVQITDQPDKVTYASANLFYSLSPYFVTGVEALYGKLETADGSNGSDFRVQFVTRYNFAHSYRSR